MSDNRWNITKTSDVIADRYAVLRLLREEPWGGVWLAHDRLLKLEVGLKFVRRDAPEYAQAREILAREAALAMTLRHPAILAAFHAGEAEEGFFLVQEPFPGESLLARLNRLQRPSLPTALHLLDQVGRALALAHEHGVVHQALNPLNVLIDGDKAKVANFACPPQVDDQVEYLELKAYTAPEVVQGEDATFAANVFSLGVLGFRLSTGSLPYPLTFDEVFPYRLETPPVDLEELPLPLQNFFLRCLAQEPEDRYLDAGDFAAALTQSREMWRTAPGEERVSWQPKAGGALKDKVLAAFGKLWESGKALTGKAGEGVKPLAAKAGGRRLLWGVGTVVFIILLAWAGAKVLKRTPPAVPPSLEVTAPAPQAPPAVTPPAAPTTEAPRAPAPAAPAVAPKPAPAPPPAAEPAPAAKEERYVVLVASYTKLEEAQALAKRLKTRNFAARVVKTSPAGATMYQVRLGPVSKKQADELAKRLKAQEGLIPKVIKVKPAGSPHATGTSGRSR